MQSELGKGATFSIYVPITLAVPRQQSVMATGSSRLSGPQLAGRLRAVRPDMRVIFMSGYADGVSNVEELGGCAFIQKPFVPETILAGVRAVLDAVDSKAT